MELLFLWIEDFRNIKRQGFDFSPEFRFKVILNKEQPKEFADYSLKISRNEGYVNLFDRNIINVTGIVGMNGSGKSTLLHCLKMLSGNLSTLLSPLIFCLRDSKTGDINTYYYKEGGNKSMLSLKVTLTLDIPLEQAVNFKSPKDYSIKRFGIPEENIKGLDFNFSEIAACFFSNTFDSHREDIYKGDYNISTNFRLEKWLKGYIDQIKNDAEKVKSIELYPSHILQYHKSELEGFVNFLSYANTRNTQILASIPKTLIVEFNFSDYEYLIDQAKYTNRYSSNDLELIQITAIRIVRQTKSKRENFLNMAILTAYYYILRIDFSDFHSNLYIGFISLIEELKRDSDRLFDSLRNQILLFINSEKDKSKNKAFNKFLGKTFYNAVNKLSFLDTERVTENKNHFSLKVDKNLWTVLDLIFDLKTLNEAKFIDYSWGGGLSSGQEAFLTHFARLNTIKNKIGIKPIWLLIDEGDLYFHPEWQRKYLQELINYINILFPNNKVQIILTTHSPFIVSDLPRQNLIFLTNDADGMCQVLNNDAHLETFGSNIHELFTQTFFLEDGLIGEFARRKIEKLIEELNQIKTEESISQEEYETNFKNRIGIIGESFIKTKLYELAASKTEIRGIDYIIEQRNIELTRLSQIKTRRSND